MEETLTYIQKYGIEPESTYPYTGKIPTTTKYHN